MWDENLEVVFLLGVITGIGIYAGVKWMYSIWQYHRDAKLSSETVKRLCREDEEIEDRITGN